MCNTENDELFWYIGKDSRGWVTRLGEKKKEYLKYFVTFFFFYFQ